MWWLKPYVDMEDSIVGAEIVEAESREEASEKIAAAFQAKRESISLGCWIPYYLPIDGPFPNEEKAKEEAIKAMCHNR